MIPAWLSFFEGLLAIALALTGLIVAHWGLRTPYFGFKLVGLALLLSVVGLVFGIIGLRMTYLSASRAAGRPRAVIGVILALIIILPIARVVATTRKYPLINDITTDTKNPPEFVNALKIPQNSGRDMKYDPKFGEIQAAAPAYAGLAPLKMEGAPDEVYKKVEIIAGEFPGWRIMSNDASTRTLEGIATSTLFQFKDDFIIQVRPDEGGKGCMVEMRSKSRDGTGDFGVNYNRIVSFFKALQGRPRGVPSPAAS